MPNLIPPEEQKHKLSYSMVLISFVLALLWWTWWVIGTSLGFSVPEWSAGECSLFMTPLIALLFGDKWREGKQKLADASDQRQA
jgi:hypothetical protein